jgi:hypothetical protein
LGGVFFAPERANSLARAQESKGDGDALSEAKSRRAGGEDRNSESKLIWTPLPEPATLCGGRGMRDVTESCRVPHRFKALTKVRLFHW